MYIYYITIHCLALAISIVFSCPLAMTTTTTEIKETFEWWGSEVCLPRLQTKLKEWTTDDVKVDRLTIPKYDTDDITTLPVVEQHRLADIIAQTLVRYDVRLHDDRSFVEILDELRKAQRAQRAIHLTTTTSGLSSVAHLEDIQRGETIRWLDLFWTAYVGDLDQYAYSRFQRDERLLGPMHAWIKRVSLNELFAHKVVTDTIPERVMMNRPLYTMIRNVMHTLQHRRDALKDHQIVSSQAQALAADIQHRRSIYGWMEKPDLLQLALVSTGQKMIENEREALRQDDHRRAVQWLQTEALIQLQRVKLICGSGSTPTPTLVNDAKESDESRRMEIQDQIWTELIGRRAKWEQHRLVCAKDEYLDYIQNEKEGCIERNDRGELEARYLSKWRIHWQHKTKRIAKQRLDRMRQQCIELTEDLLQPTHSSFIRHKTALFTFQELLTTQKEGEREKKYDDDDDGDDDDESLDDERNQVESIYAQADVDAWSRTVLTDVWQKLDDHRDSLVSFTTQWRTTALDAFKDVFASFEHVGPSLWMKGVLALWSRVDTIQSSVFQEENRSDPVWNKEATLYLTHLQHIEQALHNSIREHEDQRVADLKDVMNSRLSSWSSTKIRDVPVEWVQTLMERIGSKVETLLPLLKKQREALRDQPKSFANNIMRELVDKQMAALSRLQKEGYGPHRVRDRKKRQRDTTTITTQTSIPYKHIDAFWIALHSCILFPL